MTNNNQDKIREAFERWMIIEHFEPDMSRAAWDNGNYHNDLTLNCWIAWQAAYNQLAEDNKRLRGALSLIDMPRTAGSMRMIAKQALAANKEGE